MLKLSENSKIVQKFKYVILVSLVILLVGIGFAVYRGCTNQSILNFGIDFTGGAIIEISSDEAIDAQKIKDIIAREKFHITGDVQQSVIDGTNVYEVRLAYRYDGKTPEDEVAFIESIYKENYDFDLCAMIQNELGLEADAVKGYEVGKTASDSLTTMAIIATIVALVVMLIYIVIRFTFSSALAAVCTLLHDVIVMFALMSIFNIAINSTFIAAVITIIGYSINATIVIFDRVRAEIKLGSTKPDIEIANASVYKALNVNILASVTTLIMVIFLVILSVSSIGEFIFPIIFGLAAGAYSAIFVAPALWVQFRKIGAKIKTKKNYDGAQKQKA